LPERTDIGSCGSVKFEFDMTSDFIADLAPALQDRLVKESRLRGISTREADNAYAPSFIADFNGCFASHRRAI
jgi:hypothetical protein